MVSSIVPVSSPTVIPENPSPQLQTVLAWIAAFNRWDIDAIAATLANDNYEHQILPFSLGIPKRNKQEFIAHFTKEYKAMFTKFSVTVHTITESPSRVVVHATSVGESVTGHPYTNEYMLTCYLATDAYGNQKIWRVEEFVDSGYSKQFFLAERQRIAAQVQVV